MTRSIITSVILLIPFLTFAQDDPYAGFSAIDAEIEYSEVYSADGLSVSEIIDGVVANLDNYEMIVELSAGDSTIIYALKNRTIDVHGHGLKNASMRSQYLQPYGCTIRITAREGRYKVTATSISFAEEDGGPLDFIHLNDLLVEDGEMKRLGVADKYALDALAMDLRVINAVEEEVETSDDW